MFHTSHKVWIYLHAKRQGVTEPKWELDYDEIRQMRPAVAKATETYKLNAENYD